MNNDLISIIMPVWKPDITHMEMCIESILNQTYSNLEIIIIYKKSNNDLDYRVKKIIDKNKMDDRIKLIENDCRFVDALNFGIKNARGTKIGRMDADDICTNTRFEYQINFMKENKVSLIGSWAYSISHDGKVIGRIEPPYKSKEIRKKIMFHNPLLHSSILMEKKMLEEIGYYDSNFFGAEDYELYLRALSRNYKIANIPKHLIYLREANQSIMRGNQWRATRKAYIKVKKIALFHYGFNRYYDICYWLITPLTLFVSPKMAYAIKNTIGWNKIAEKNQINSS